MQPMSINPAVNWQRLHLVLFGTTTIAVFATVYYYLMVHWERDIAQWLERGALLMSLPAVRFRIPLGAEFSEKYHIFPSQYWNTVSMLCPWTRHLTLKCFTWFKWKWVPGRTEMAMCMISSMHRNGCSTVWSPWSWDSTWMNRSSDQGAKI